MDLASRSLLLLVAVTVGLSRANEDESISIGATGDAIQAFVKDAHKQIGFTGTVLGAKDGKVVAAVAVGSTNGDNPAPITTTTLFEIASSTKAFTAIAILRLRDQKKLNLDDSIGDHLPGVPDNCRAITIRHLLQHTSGIPNTNMHGSGNDLAVVLPLFLKGGPRHEPGTRHQYWNQGYGLLSEIVARVSGRPYVDFCKDEIFTVCQMNASRFNGDVIPPGVTVATGVSSRGAARSALDHPYDEYGFSTAEPAAW